MFVHFGAFSTYRLTRTCVDGASESREAIRYKPMRLSDGGTVANNPAFIALQEAWAYCPLLVVVQHFSFLFHLFICVDGAPGCSLHEFVSRQVDCIVSIGTGDQPQKRARSSDDIGSMQLAWEIFNHRAHLHVVLGVMAKLS